MSDVRPLMHAIQNRDTEAARAALARDASQATDPLPGGLSPLMFALYNGAQEIAELLRAYRPLSLHEAVALDDTPAVLTAGRPCTSPPSSASVMRCWC